MPTSPTLKNMAQKQEAAESELYLQTLHDLCDPYR